MKEEIGEREARDEGSEQRRGGERRERRRERER